MASLKYKLWLIGLVLASLALLIPFWWEYEMYGRNFEKLNLAIPAAPKMPAVQLPQTLALKPAQNSATTIDNVWILQLDTFSQQAEALRLVRRLKLQGITASMRALDDTHWQVWVGPFVEMAEAKQVQAQILRHNKIQIQIQQASS